MDYRSKANFVFTKLKISLRQLFPRRTPCASVHFCAPLIPFCSDGSIREMKNHPTLHAGHGAVPYDGADRTMPGTARQREREQAQTHPAPEHNLAQVQDVEPLRNEIGFGHGLGMNL